MRERNGKRPRRRLPEAADVYESMRHEMTQRPISAYARRVIRGEVPETLPLPFPPTEEEDAVAVVQETGPPTTESEEPIVAIVVVEGEALTCPECGRTFEKTSQLGAHRLKAHGVQGTSRAAQDRRAKAERPGIRTGPPYTCPDCGREFASASGLGRHRLIHGATSERAKAREQAPPPPPPVSSPSAPPEDVGARLMAALTGEQRVSVDYVTLARLAEWIEEGKRLAVALR